MSVVTDPQHLFLVGLGRSGTTALTDLFAAHPRIVMGMERYKFLYPGGAQDVTPELYTRERFFTFDESQTNLRPGTHWRWDAHYEAQEKKYDDALYVGDKLTRVVVHQLWRRLPKAKFICIVRPVEDVAASWQARADNPDDAAWPQRNGAAAAVRAWNSGLKRIAKAIRLRPDDLVVLDYERTFGDPEAASVRGALDWLGLDFPPEFAEKFGLIHRQYVREIRDKDRTLTPEQRDYVLAEADMGLWAQVGPHML